MGHTTVSLRDERKDATSAAICDCLIVAMDCARPLALPRRAALTGVDEVVIGRGPALAFRRAGRTLALDLPDASVSSLHARLARGEAWTLTDEGSKNGTWVNGERVERRALAPGDLVEVGPTFFLVGPGRGDLDPEMLAARLPGMRTLSPQLERLLALLTRVAPAGVPVLLLGETGTGKEVTARALHQLSGRAGRFTAMNCGGVPETLLASELFGARKGAYSGAHADRAGLVQEAHHGTLFLDEIAELPLAAQAVLLRVIQEREVVPLGATRPVPVDARIVAATHVDLAEHVATRQFRKDLYARISGFTLTLPPLRARKEDLGLLCADLLPRVAGARADRVSFHRTAARALFAHDWPLNIRELEHALATAVPIADGDEIWPEHLPAGVRGVEDETVEGQLERERFIALVAAERGNVSAIARGLATSRTQVRRLAERYGIDLDKLRDREP